MITDDQTTIITNLIDSLDGHLKNNETMLATDNLHSLANMMAEVSPLEWRDIRSFIIDHLEDPLFCHVVRTALPYFLNFVHSHQPDPEATANP